MSKVCDHGYHVIVHGTANLREALMHESGAEGVGCLGIHKIVLRFEIY